MINPKPFKEYPDLMALLHGRKMSIKNDNYAIKKLSQVGYYRLSGFWHTARKPNVDNSLGDDFLPDTKFEEIYRLYIFDKKLRLLLLDIIERLEIHIRGVIAHEMGRIDPLSYQKEEFIQSSKRRYFEQWSSNLQDKIDRCNDEFIRHHREKNMSIPFWVIVEVWDFGCLSKYFSILDTTYQNAIAKRFNIDRNLFASWLQQINFLRNCAAHHSRVWNRLFTSDITLPDPNKPKFKRYKKANEFFTTLNLDNNRNVKSRLFIRIAVMWYLVNQTSTNYKWLDKLHSLIKEDFPNVPNAKLESMGINGDISQIIQLLKKDRCD